MTDEVDRLSGDKGVAYMLALDESEGTLEAFKATLAHFDGKIDQIRDAEHWGDCTDFSSTCIRCAYEDAKARLAVFHAALSSAGLEVNKAGTREALKVCERHAQQYLSIAAGPVSKDGFRFIRDTAASLTEGE
tara:strand:- start:1980 stop:2378 length:399 start_codon:yes stop_codon:yes gene_type:complete